MMDPSTAQGWAGVFGGGLSGAIIATLMAGNVFQYALGRRDRAIASKALEEANRAHLETAKSVASIAKEFAVAMDSLRGRHHRANMGPQQREGT